MRVTITADCWPRGGPVFPYEDSTSDFYKLSTIQYQGEIIYWLQREFREDVEVKYALYEDYLVVLQVPQNTSIYIPECRARLSNLLLLDKVIKDISYKDSWHPPENP